MSNFTTSSISRRRFLQWTAMGSSAAFLAACGNQPAPAAAPTAAPTEPPEEPTATPEPAAEAPAETEMSEINPEDVNVMVSDVVDYVLDSDDWAAPYGSVTFKFHEVMYNGESAYLIRTDASDPGYAEEQGLVFVPLLNAAVGMDVTNTLYTFSDDRPSVISMIPGDEGYSSLFAVKAITVDDSALTLDSAEAVMAAVDDGAVTMDEGALFVNHPLIKWPGGELSVDSDLDGPPLMNGQLFGAPDTSTMEVTMKLHQCYPGSRYIVTDAGMMAPMMNVSDAAPTNQLKELGGTDEIWVFGNGIPGPGVMGFQPAIFDNKAGEPAWSPFWDHFTVTWVDESNARVLTDSAQLREAIDAGELELFNGVPDSHPDGFVVNCPAPILAPNNFAA